MTQFAVFVTKAPYESNNAFSALSFCRAAVANGHTIKHVFFYASATHIASNLSSFNSGETDVQSLWVALKKETDISLKVCTTAASRRGIACKDDNMEFSNYNQNFEPVGMLEYFLALRSNDVKSVQF